MVIPWRISNSQSQGGAAGLTHSVVVSKPRARSKAKTPGVQSKAKSSMRSL
jgi:hypothetical protein